jgi:hypothetical protein
VRSKLEYADIVWDGLSLISSDKLEKVQINAIRMVTGLAVSAHLHDLYLETGLLPLQKKEKVPLTSDVFKALNGLGPSYLRNLIPEFAHERHNHNSRNSANRITAFICRTTPLYNSFILATMRD